MEYWKNYPDSNLTRPVQNPAQSWNALTVGAYTEKSNLDMDTYKSMQIVAQSGELSPYSSTSVCWDTKWPIKPEIVLEGGNVIRDPWGCYSCEELSTLTTYYKPNVSQFTTIWATSAATAEAAYLAAELQARYPKAWPETVRALLVHSAEWTEKMKSQFLNGTNKNDYRKLLRTCGYGVPNIHKAIECIDNHVNLIIQSELQPFDKQESRYVSKDMNIHEIPWPKETLEEMKDIPIEMRVTLSYFIEPGPGEIGWKDRYRYPSCALRFDTNGADTKEVFTRRISKASDDGEDIRSSGGTVNWLLGPNNRNVGSIHSDIWIGTAGQLSTSSLIAVYPAVGWWRERTHLKSWDHKVRYSLVISLSTPKVENNLYTPIINKIEERIKTTTLNKTIIGTN